MPSRFLRSLALFFAVLLLTTSAFGQIDTTATIVGWNLKGFGAIPDSRLSSAARVIADFDREVIALAEVNPDDVVDKLILELSKLGAFSQGEVVDRQFSHIGSGGTPRNLLDGYAVSAGHRGNTSRKVCETSPRGPSLGIDASAVRR